MRVENANPKQHLRRRAAAMAIASTLCIASSAPMAAVIDSGPVNLAVPVTAAGIYLNLVTNATGITSASTPGWDFNPFSASGNIAFFTSASIANISSVVGSGTTATALTPGATIGPASSFATPGTASTSGTAFRNTGTEYVGIRFNNEATGVLNYGYVQLQTTAATGFPATIKRYVYENTGLPIIIAAGGPTVIFGYNSVNKHLVSFDGSFPAALLTDVSLTGLSAGETLRGFDFRPANGMLYAIASTGVAGTVGGDRMVTINTTTGAVTAVTGAVPLTTPAGSSFGLDFNAVVDRFREVSDSEVNLRLNPNSGTLAGTDTALAYAAGDPNVGVNPNVVHVAYNNNMAGATTTTLFGIDSGLDTLVTIGGPNGVPSPNGGQLTTIGPLGVNPDGIGGFDIHFGTNIAYAALRTGGVSQLYTVNLTTGAATLVVGAIGGGLAIDGLSVAFAPAANLVSAQSRRVHGGAGTFDLPLSVVPTNPTTEPRLGPAQTVVFTFDRAIIGATATITGGSATAGAPIFSGNDVIVDLTAVTDQQYVTISLTNVADALGGVGAGGSVRIGFLAGDVSQNRVVTVADLGLVNAQLAQPVTAANYLKDVNISGTLTVADKGITNANLTHSLPAP
jgi:hypothetical protein